MAWIGKIIGGAIGLALGGPLGAIAGATFGHAFDMDDESYVLEGDGRHMSDGEREQLTFFVAAFSMMAKLAQADGGVSKQEVDTIETIMQRDLNLNSESRTIALNIFRAARQSPEPFENFAEQFFRQFQFRPQLLELMLDILLRVSIADGRISAEEERLIRSAVRIFRFSEDTYLKIKSKYVSDTDKYYAVLGCSRDDTDDHIKQQYRKRVQEYHPDKIVAKGLPDEFVKFAGEKFREIQEAYEAIKKERAGL